MRRRIPGSAARAGGGRGEAGDLSDFLRQQRLARIAGRQQSLMQRNIQ